MLRMLRMAVDVHRELDSPALLDPMGSGTLQVTKTDAGIEMRTAITAERQNLLRVVTRS